jgi:2-dehydro-3-deoxy-D-gluconate 5-dehydrogenase
MSSGGGHIPFDLTGKVAAVTGANSGLGQAIAIGLAQAGADIVALGRSEPGATAGAVAELGRRCHWQHADLDTVAGLPQAVAEAIGAFGTIDILVNNAGTIRRADALEFSEADWDAVMAVNLKTAFFLSQAVARTWVDAGRRGKIINIASLLSFQGGARVASYTASKSGLLGLTRLLANEWAKHGINVNAIAPGYFATANTQALRDDAERNRQILERIPAGRWGQPGDLAGAAVFLACAVLPVDGGWLAR